MSFYMDDSTGFLAARPLVGWVGQPWQRRGEGGHGLCALPPCHLTLALLLNQPKAAVPEAACCAPPSPSCSKPSPFLILGGQEAGTAVLA